MVEQQQVRTATHHPWKVELIGPGNSSIKVEGAAGFTCARKAGQKVVGKPLGNTRVKEVRIFGNPHFAPAKFREFFKNVGGRDCFVLAAG